MPRRGCLRSPSSVRSRARLPLALLGVSVVLLAGCGTRLSSSQAQNEIRLTYGSGGTAAGTSGTSGTSGSAGSAGSTGVTGGGTGTSTGSGGVSGTGTTGSSGSGTGGGSSSTGTSGGGRTTTGGGSSSSGGTGASAGATKAPIVVGMNCDCSGVVGGAHAAGRDAWIAWKNWVNAHGGIDGHPIKLLYADDNNSASQAIQNVKNFVENGHAVALVHLVAASGGLGPIAKYAQQHHIAVVGGSGYEGEWTQYSSMFSSATADPAQDYAWAAEMKNSGKKVVGAVYCSEAQVCTDKEAIWKKAAQKLGLQVKYEAKESLANPNYGPDCAQARSQGIEALVVIEDGASASRVARDCGQQNYRPVLIIPQPFNNPPPSMEGGIAPIGSFPWFLTSGSPALSEYGQALKQYMHGDCTSYCSLGWSDGKLLQKALTGHVSATPTGQDVLTGLWAMHNETLGGLTPPMTFHKDQPADPIRCAFRAVVKGGTWIAPLGMQPVDCS